MPSSPFHIHSYIDRHRLRLRLRARVFSFFGSVLILEPKPTENVFMIGCGYSWYLAGWPSGSRRFGLIRVSLFQTHSSLFLSSMAGSRGPRVCYWLNHAGDRTFFCTYAAVGSYLLREESKEWSMSTYVAQRTMHACWQLCFDLHLFISLRDFHAIVTHNFYMSIILWKTRQLWFYFACHVNNTLS